MGGSRRVLRRAAPAVALWVAALVGAGAAVAGWQVRPTTATHSEPPVQASAHAEHWRVDLDQLAAGLAHYEDPDAFRAGKTQFDRRLSALRAQAATASDDQMMVGIMAAVASFGIAHTHADPPPWFTQYPITLQWFGDGIHVVAAAAPYTSLLGAVLTAIGDTPADAAYRRVSTVVAHENEAWLRDQVPRFLVDATVLHGLGILAPGRDEFTFRTLDGRLHTVTLAGGSAGVSVAQKSVRASVPLYAERPDEPFWYSYLGSSRTLYVRYLRCTDPVAFAQLTREVFATTTSRPVRRLVVDLRGNGGGDSSVFAPFLAALQASPLNRPGRLFVLFDQGTFSSAELNALQLTEMTRATTLGQPTGGKPNSYGEVDAFTLPYSQMSITYATKYFQTVAGDPAALYPAITIDTSYAAYAAGADPVLDAVLETA